MAIKVYASHNPNAEIRKESSAGGLFTLIAERIIESGGVVYGVGFDNNWQITHLRVDDAKDLSHLRGSKYAYSIIGDTLNNISKDLEGGKEVLFSGTPCQAAAVRKRFGENSKLLIVEVVCHGAPEQKYWEAYLQAILRKKGKKLNDIEAISFRDKVRGWKNYNFTISFKDGSLYSESHSDNLYMRAFLKDYILRTACFKCGFKYTEGTRADMTLGDFWGIDQLAPEINNNEGTTIAIVRTAKGKEYADLFKNPTMIELSSLEAYNPAIFHSANRPADYEEFQAKFTEYRKKGKSEARILKLFKQYAGRPLLLTIKIKLYRLIHRK